jgi:threonine/homoserine/homoserine lactone efflux protein
MLIHLVFSGLAASVSPVSVTVLVAMQAGKQGKRNSFYFLGGYLLLLAVVGVMVVAFLHGIGAAGPSKADGYVEIAIGALCVAASPYTMLKKGSGKEGAGGLSAPKAFLVGVLAMSVNFSTWVCYSAGLNSIVQAEMGLPAALLSLALLVLLASSTLLLPLLFFVLFPVRARGLLDPLSHLLVKYGRATSAAVLLGFGAYLLVKGISAVA